MNPQRELPPLPTVSANDIIAEKIKDLERQCIFAESKGDDATCRVLHRERARLKGLMKTRNWSHD